MTVNYCDMCGKDLTETMDDLFGSREFIVLDANSKAHDKIDMTLCYSCKKTLYYLLQNPELLKTHVREMKLGNRIRFLLKMPLKEG